MMEEGTNVFSIKDLENFSGIKAHTIRIWEKRYNIVEPDRTDSNIRYYSEAELKKILNVAYLNRNGLKISKIARLDDDELTQRVMTVSSSKDSNDNDFQPGKILMSAIRFNEGLFKETLLPFIEKYGIEESYCRFFHPLLEKTRILWQTGSLSRAQEQFIRYTIRQLIIVEDMKLNTSGLKNDHVAVMINPSNNLCENNFAFYKYALRKRGFEVIYTGDILPSSEVTEIFRIKPFDYLIVNSSAFDFKEKKISYFINTSRLLKLKALILTDYPGGGIFSKYDMLVVTHNPPEFTGFLDR